MGFSFVVDHGFYGARASVVAVPGALERRLSSCGTRAYLLAGLWDLPRPGIEPMSPALAGGFLPPSHQGSLQQFSEVLILKHIQHIAKQCQYT